MFVLGVFLRLPAERAFFLAPAEDKEEEDEGAEEAIVNGGGFVVVVEEQRTVTSKSGLWIQITERRGRDAVLDPHDPLPFLALHHIHIPALLARSALEGRDWHHIDFNIRKLVQNGGD